MTLTPGTKLGPYEIQFRLGAGGMGEVYRARDTRLDRAVAIKVLPAHFSKDAVRKQRFEREAKTISGLNHPNICTLHDVGSQDGIDYLVMEFIEGESLAQRLLKGPLSVEQVLKIGRDIADALDKAHRYSIIHRDLKPGNVMLTKSGAKLLDFGLARPTSHSTSLATLTAAAPQQALTEEGMIVGTFQYMSPEQVEGKDVDARSDIFSLGAVLYEMVTGKRAFEGKSQFSVASAILEKEPAPISTIKPMSPRSLDNVIRRCLVKEPDDRWQSARDLSLELKSISAEESLAAASSNPAIRPVGGSLRGWLGWCVAALLAISVIFSLVRLWTRTPPSQQTMRASILAPDGREFDRWGVTAISPDGKYLVFLATVPGWSGQLWIRRIDSLTAKPLPGTEGAQSPFWSPDSKWIGFAAGSKLRKISVDGGSPLVICDSGQLRGGSWSPNGTILFVPGVGVPVYSVPDAGGTPVEATHLDKSGGELTHRWPVFLPDGKHFLFFSRGRENAIYVSSVDSKERKLILKNETNALYASPGYLLFVQNGVLLAQQFDADRLELKGSPAAVADDVPVFGGQQHGLFSASANGILAIHSKQELLSQPIWVDQSGKPVEALMDPAIFVSYNMRMSPDGRKIAFGITDPKDGADNIWVHDVASHQTTRLTFEELIAQHPVWSPDGGRLLYTSNRIGQTQTFSIPVTGVGEAELLAPSDYIDMASSWSPDGRYIVFVRAPIERTLDLGLWVLPLFGEKKAYPLFAVSHSQQWGAVFSPDGKWIAYTSNESGDGEIYIVSFPDARAKIQVSKNRSDQPRWSSDGRRLFYGDKDHSVVAASLRVTTKGIEVADTRTLFKLDIPNFEVSGDGKRFLVFKTVDNQEPSTVTLISNWMNALPR
jgi:eukaryotic-like serine/threonine-protein kinase